jgi:hypothetical protein
MLIGNRDRFGLELFPVAPTWERRYAPEATGWAGLSVWAKGSNLCRHVRAGEEDIRDVFYVPLAPLADWIVRQHAAMSVEERAAGFMANRRLHEAVRTWGDAPPPAGMDEDSWLDAREAFWMRHFLAAGADGARLPNVAFLRADDDVLVAWDAPRFAAPPAVEMLHPRGAVTLPWHDVSTILLELADHVVRAFAAAGTPMPYPWMSETRAAWVHLEPRLAIELYCGRTLPEVAELLSVPESELSALLLGSTTGDPAASPLSQVMRDLPPRPSPGIGLEIQQAGSRAAIAAPARRAAWLAGRALAADAARAGGTPEEQGQEAARAVRDELGHDGQPIESVPDLLSHFGVGLHQSAAHFQRERMVIAGRSDASVSATVLRTARTETSWGRRFEEARALGHALLDPLREGAMGAASTRWAQPSRRRRSGAFAAELLLPSSALGDLSDGVLDGAAEPERFEELLHRYGVGATTAANQLLNQGWLSEAAIRDELIEVFGHGEE